jgi:hypothetical protein
MSAQGDPTAQVKLQNRRRGERVNSRVPVAIEWERGDGTLLRENAHTRVVNAYGCLLVAPRDLEREQRVRIINLANFRSNQAVVVWKGKERTEGWELGVELVRPEMDFWGLEL